jgi:ankyrin repeat protein
VGVVRWLLDNGAAANEENAPGVTALRLACSHGRPPLVRLLLERGADPTIADHRGSTPMMEASWEGHLEVVRLLLGHASAKATLNQRDRYGATALWYACYYGRGGVVRALLENGADPTIATKDGTTPMAVAKRDPPLYSRRITAEGHRQCVAALEVRSCSLLSHLC